MKIYLAGPMTGKEEFNFPEFQKFAEGLRQKHYEVVSPHELHPDIKPGSKPWNWYVKEGLKALLECDTVALMPGWEDSRGAVIEMNVADATDMFIFEIDPDDFSLTATPYGNMNQAALQL